MVFNNNTAIALPWPTSPRAIALTVIATITSIWLMQRWLEGNRQKEIERRFALEHGCQPLRPWTAKWPLGLDFLVKALEFNKRKQILKFFLDVVEESGATHQQHLLGGRAVNTIDPENVKAVLSTNFNDYTLGLRTPHFRPLLGSGIFTQDGAAWEHSRQLLQPQFRYNRTQNFEQIKKSVQQLIDGIPKDGSPVNLQPLCFKLTFDTTMFLLFGESAVSASDWGEVAGKESEFAQAFNTAQDYLALRGRLGPFYWLLNDSTFRNACRTCHRFVDQAVSKALKLSANKSSNSGKHDRDVDGGKAGYVFVDALVQQTKDPQVIRDQCLNVLLAGRDTTGCALQWTFRLLSRHQHVLSKLRAEVEQITGLGPLGEDAPLPTRDDLKKMVYLDMVIKEVLRLYPSVPVNAREAQRLTVLPTGGGPDGKSPVLVRPGEGVGYCVYAMHRRKDIYGPDAHEFRPERWEEESMKPENIGWAYRPFNGGPRLCLGKDFAELLVSYTVARLVQVFPRIEAPNGEPHVAVGDEKQNLTLVVSSADGCMVSLGY
ncbi:n-alkane-inducible cytochrome P450 [Apodospora peruviana]|uniref:N-alkane-inducible cytochrome P450 n=1 Tax=Apodospora peruviana TaxID=516989 RepID=A0AAE0M484_9PEZI|nr:n-alkane-inducible cytochrome P450 [Apodospora peruviana]